MKNTKIEWADHTFNPWIGCTKVSPACDHCYAEVSMPAKMQRVAWGPTAERLRTSKSNWLQPLRWDKEAARLNVRPRVFCASLADVFDNAVNGQWRIDLMRLILDTPHLEWLLLTKRIGNAASMLETAFRAVHAGREGWTDNVPPNVWIGATICNQEEADRDIPKLLATPAAKRFLSLEPLLGPVDMTPAYLPCPTSARHGGPMMDQSTGSYECCRECDYTGISDEMGIDWVIVGGESGHNARPMHPDWVRSLRDQCQAAGVPFFFKQWGEWVDADNGPADDAAYEGKADCWAHIDGGHHDGAMGVDFFRTYPMYRVGKKAAGRLLDGREWNGIPKGSTP